MAKNFDSGNPTITFSIKREAERQMKKTLTEVFNALLEKGHDPINQIVGYLLTEDPTYITSYNNARSEIRKIDREELLQTMVRHYLGATPPTDQIQKR